MDTTIFYKDDNEKYCQTGKEELGFGYNINYPVPFYGANFLAPDADDPVLQVDYTWIRQDPNTWNYYTNNSYCDTNSELVQCDENMVFKGDKTDPIDPQPKCRPGVEGELVINNVPGPAPEPQN